MKPTQSARGGHLATVIQAYRFALDPTLRQKGQLASHAGAARFAFNWGLAFFKTRLDQYEGDPTVPVPWTLFELQREWNRAKHEVAPWWAENSRKPTSPAWTLLLGR